MASKLLRLRAEDVEDLKVVSAAVQDAVFLLQDLSFDKKSRRFVATLNRFRWERAKRHGPFERIRAALSVEDALSVRSRNVRLGAPDSAGVLLHLAFEAAPEPPAGALVLTLAGGGALRIEVECLDVALTDMGEPWLTPNRPDHERV